MREKDKEIHTPKCGVSSEIQPQVIYGSIDIA